MKFLPRRARPAASRGSAFFESTLAELAWERMRRGVRRWAAAGLCCGAAAGAIAFAPAGWLADGVGRASGGRLLLADARGSVWSGSAVPVLAGGPGSRSAAVLPGRLSWTVGLRGGAIAVRLGQPCCIEGAIELRLRPGFGGLTVELPSGADSSGDWPAAWLAGLGAPWNSLQLGGTLRVGSPGLRLHYAAGGWRFEGQADLQLSDMASRLSTLDRLGSYQLQIEGRPGEPATLRLTTLDGALQLQGNGQWTGANFRFRGEARAAPGFEPALDNLLNMLGRRQGAQSLLAIG